MDNLLIVGHGEHGKDFLAEIWEEAFGLLYKGSSMACAEIFIYDALKDKYGYTSFEECFEDRKNHRAEWKQMISDYNTPDKARLGKEILERADCYVGMRDKDEIAECLRQGLFDLIIWVDASERMPPEPEDSMGITKEQADFIIENNGTKEEFIYHAKRLGRILFRNYKPSPEKLKYHGRMANAID